MRRSSWLHRAPRLDAWREVAPPSPHLGIVVVMPVRNEADRLEAALEALADQVGVAPERREVLLLANNCDDQSAAIARRFAARHPSFPLRVAEVRLPARLAHIGYVRGELMNEACRRLASVGSAGFVASTDADTLVARDWLTANEAEIAAGADAVGGRIFVDDVPPPSRAALRSRRLDAAHALLGCRVAASLDPDPANPWPHHHQHFGASLAVRAGAYEQVGGMPRVKYLEDEALVRAFERADLRVRRSPAVRVRTSARLDGRAEIGLSWQLRQWADGIDDDPLVADPEAFIAAVRARAAWRGWWQRGRRARGADGLRASVPLPASLPGPLPGAWLSGGDIAVADLLAEARTFGAFWAEVEARSRELEGEPRRVPRSAAIATLRAWLRAQEAISKSRR